MQIIHLNQDTYEAGKAAFRNHAAGEPGGSRARQPDGSRSTGPRVIVGAILACIEEGHDSRSAILDRVTRVSRCWRSTVALVLDGLEGDDPAACLWQQRDGRYVTLPEARRRPLLLAS